MAILKLSGFTKAKGPDIFYEQESLILNEEDPLEIAKLLDNFKIVEEFEKVDKYIYIILNTFRFIAKYD